MGIKKTLIALTALGAIILALTGCDSSESWNRSKKDWDSEHNGGLNRELIVYSETGQEVWRFNGKFDIDYSDDRILFDDENNLRHIIYFQNGIVIVNEI